MNTLQSSSEYHLIHENEVGLSAALRAHLMDNRSSLPLVFWVDFLKQAHPSLKSALCDRTARYVLSMGQTNHVSEYIAAIRSAWHDVFVEACFAAEQAKLGAMHKGAQWAQALFINASDREIARSADTIKLGHDSLPFLGDEEWTILLSAISKPQAPLAEKM